MNTIEKALLSPEVDALAEQKIAQAQKESELLKRAATTPLPGPTRDIFKAAADIPVGPWKVRPIYDLDFTLLEEMNHPVAKMMQDSFAGKEGGEEYIPKGPTAWILFWMFTRPVEEMELAVSDLENEMPLAHQKARAEFGRQPFKVLLELYKAVVKQIEICTSAEATYGAPAQEGEVASAAVPKS